MKGTVLAGPEDIYLRLSRGRKNPEMKLDNVGTVIATRELTLGDGRKVTVTLGRPEKCSDSADYYCPYQITGLGNERVRYAGGVDAIQAIQLGLNMIGADLYTSKEAQTGVLRWEGGSKGDLGFPVPKILRDLAPEEDY